MIKFIPPPDGTAIAAEADILDPIGNAGYNEAPGTFACRPSSPDFFKLSTGLAGAILQKCMNLSLSSRLTAIYPAVYAPVSTARCRDFVWNPTRRHCTARFVTSEADL